MHVSWKYYLGHRLVEERKASGRKVLNPPSLQPPTLCLYPRTPRNWGMASWLGRESRVIRIFLPRYQKIFVIGEKVASGPRLPMPIGAKVWKEG